MPSSPIIAMTGATGRLGSLILRELLGAGYTDIRCLYRNAKGLADSRVTWVQGDLTDAFSLDALVEGVDTLVHAAGLMSYRPADKIRLFRVNETGTRHLVDAGLSAGVRHMVYLGTVAALGFRPQLELYDEQTIWVKSPLTTPYAESMYRGELEVWRGREEGLGVSVLLPAMILMPGSVGNSESLLARWRALGRRSYPPGGHSFVDGRDVGRFVRQVIASGPTAERVILSGFDMTYRTLLTEVAARLDSPAPKRNISFNLALLRSLIDRLFAGNGPTPQEVKMAFRTNYVHADRSREKYGFSYTDPTDTLDALCRRAP
jgi:dihydroflavonol-4-reductase